MTADKRPLKVFLCHAHADRDAVRALYTRLTNDGVDAWLDKEKLLPGQDWELEIKKAVREADVVVVCLSKQFNQAGFRQKEVRLALDTAMEKPEGEIFVIPARLEECDNLESLRKWHWVDLFESDGYIKLMQALQKRISSINTNSPREFETSLSDKNSLSPPRENVSKVRENRVSVGDGVTDSVIVVGDGNVINMNVDSMFSKQGVDRVEKQTVNGVIKEIKNQIEFGLYNEAYRNCVSILTKSDNNAHVSLLAGIAYILDKGENKLRDHDFQVIEKHISSAIRESKVRPTALAVLGCIKYGYYHLNKIYDSSKLNLKFIKEELQDKSALIDKELLGLIKPVDYALDFLEV
ncbi:MAG: toll/interleukin-1 receptor domain-containing protein [Chloroflexi bacterium]|nr:toll/interleukin-1 receptor domain-containing protein [Chloroflexota bacterium]